MTRLQHDDAAFDRRLASYQATAYRGYLVCASIHGVWIEKDNTKISWAKSGIHAREMIDDLTGAR